VSLERAPTFQGDQSRQFERDVCLIKLFYTWRWLFRDSAPYSFEEVNHLFRGAYCIDHHGVHGISKHFWMPVNFYETTLGNIPEDCHHTHSHENLKSHGFIHVCLLG
jgi:hypothetical protein